MNSITAEWKHPDELIKLHRLKKKQKALQDRVGQIKTPGKEAKQNVATRSKRRNPFLKDTESMCEEKKTKLEDFASEETICEILATRKIPEAINIQGNVENEHERTFPANYSEQKDEEKPLNIHRDLPIDWSMKSKLRILSRTQVFANQLKMNQEASGLSSFVRCIDHNTTTTGLDISPGALFHQSTLYWQHPSLPWLTLFPRNSKLNSGCTALGENERAALMSEWRNSFASLFQLVRTRQCPYFYLVANTFTVIFRAAGICGRCEVHAIMTPTTRGMRSALRESNIEFTLPLKHSPSSANTSHNKSDSDLNESTDDPKKSEDQSESDDEEGQEKWLESMGVAAEEIKRIQANRSRKQAAAECENDFSDLSLILIDGFECNALFNFLLNSKSLSTMVGKLAGVPPTLISPVAFQGANLKRLTTKSNKVRVDGVDYFSVELQGPILPHLLPYLISLLRTFNDHFSITMVNHQITTALSRVSKVLMTDVDKENKSSDFVFGRENLSECGLPLSILELMCRVDRESVNILERVTFSKELGGFTFD